MITSKDVGASILLGVCIAAVSLVLRAVEKGGESAPTDSKSKRR